MSKWTDPKLTSVAEGIAKRAGKANQLDVVAQKEIYRDVMAALVDLTPSPAVPEGYKLVPVEPTTEMILQGGAQLISSGEYEPTAADGAYEIYRAMLNASPSPGVDPSSLSKEDIT